MEYHYVTITLDLKQVHTNFKHSTCEDIYPSLKLILKVCLQTLSFWGSERWLSVSVLPHNERQLWFGGIYVVPQRIFNGDSS